MNPKIVFVAGFPGLIETAREMVPPDFELYATPAAGPDCDAALAEADYLVGFVDAMVGEELYRKAPKLRLIQLLSAGYDRADIAAARRAGVPVANNGGANSVAVAEHAVMLMLAVSRQLVRQHARRHRRPLAGQHDSRPARAVREDPGHRRVREHRPQDGAPRRRLRDGGGLLRRRAACGRRGRRARRALSGCWTSFSAPPMS